jgi:hypothetical protein
LSDEFGCATVQIGRVHKGIKLAIRERFHAHNLPESPRSFKRHPPKPITTGGKRDQRIL